MRTFSCFFLLFCSLFIQSTYASFNIADLAWAKDVGARQYPRKTTIYNVSDYGAKSDGTTLNTIMIQKAIDACASNGGGVVSFDKGTYLTGAIFVKEGVNLQIPKGTTLLGSQNINDYPEIDTRVAGIEMRWPSALINVQKQKNILISGDGIVHAQGKIFWDAYWKMRTDYEARGLRWIVDYDCKRPRTLLVSDSEDVTIKGLTFQQAGFWTIQILYSTYCTVDGVVIQNNVGGHGPSTDGIDVDSSSRILIENCDIDCNDDNFCLKAGRDADGLRVNRPTEYVVIRNSISRSGGGLLTCGSETSGGIRHILAYGLKAYGTNSAFRLKSAMNRGGTIENIYVKDVELNDVGIAFEASMNWHPAYSYSVLPKEYKNKPIPEHWTKMLEKVEEKDGTPYFKNIYFSDISVNNANRLIDISGSKESLMENFHFDNIKGKVNSLGNIDYAQNWEVADVDVVVKEQKDMSISNSQNVKFPSVNSIKNKPFAYTLKVKNDNSSIVADESAELAFYLNEMAGNLRFGLVKNDRSEWLSDLKSAVNHTDKVITYSFSGSLLNKGSLDLKVVSLSESDGVVLEVQANNIPNDLQLFWSYGGAYGSVLDKDEHGRLKPEYCADNVFSVEHTAFTLYYGESMKLKTINAVMPVSSEIRLSDALKQESPLRLFNSGKKTDAPVVSGLLPLKNGKKEYFSIYRQNDKADYNHFMLPRLFEREFQLNSK